MKLKIMLAAALLAAGCSSDPNRLPPANPFKPEQRSARELRLEASQLYKAARDSLDTSDFATAIERYDKLMQRFPFSEYATQAQLEKIYAQYRNYDHDAALAGAERFLREHPRHASAAYVQYLKGLANFDREEGLTDMLGLDATQKDMGYSRRAFDDFGLLVQKYPNSPYAADARQRMIYLRNRIAESEMHAVRFYTRRGAYVAAAKRGEQILAQYPGAPVAMEALAAMEKSYRSLGLTPQADEAAALLAANRQTAAAPAADAPVAKAAAVPPPEKKTGWTVEFGDKQLIGPDAGKSAAPTGESGTAAEAAATPSTPAPKKSGWTVELGDEQVVGPEADARRAEAAKKDAKAETSPTTQPAPAAPAQP